MAQDWDIKSRDTACSACQKLFEDQEHYCSALRFGEEGYTRSDYCDACWGESTASTAYSAWQGTFRLPPPRPEDPVNRESAEDLLRRLMEGENPEHTNVIYILAVMLERKRILVEKDVHIEPDATRRVYEHRKSGETFIVRDPRLRLDELEHVQQEVVAMLDGPESGNIAEAESESDSTPG